MAKQQTFAGLAWQRKGKKTRREQFLAEMDAIIPWPQLLELIEARGRQWAYSTVATLLRRLESKGYATSESINGSLVYRAALSREDLLERRLKEAAAELCDGAAVPLVLALVQGNRFTTEELDRIRRIIDEAKTKVVRRKEW